MKYRAGDAPIIFEEIVMVMTREEIKGMDICYKKSAIAAPGTPGDFRASPRSVYKIAKWVTSLTRLHIY